MANGDTTSRFGNFAPDMNYLLSPLEQYQRYAMQQMPSQYGVGGASALSPYARRALTSAFTPNYQAYQFYEPAGAYGTFSDFLGTAGAASSSAPMAPSRQDIRDRMLGLSSSDPLMYQYYMGDDNAMERQQNLAMMELLAPRAENFSKNRARFNPALQAAARGAVENLYQDYIGNMGGAAAGTPSFGKAGPTGFLNYYMGRRGIAE